MSKWTKYFGISGCIVFIFGLFLSYAVAYDANYVSLSHLLLGAALLLVFVYRGGLSIFRSKAAVRTFSLSFVLGSYSLLFFGLLIVVNVLFFRFDPLYFDSTIEKVHTLAPQSQKVLESLKDDIVIRAFYLGSEVEPAVKELLSNMKRKSDKIAWEAIDPEKNPVLVEKYGINERSTLHLSFRDQKNTREVKVVRNINEQEIINALLKLTRGEGKKAYYLFGHGEANLDEPSEAGFLFLKEAIQGENIKIERLNSSAQLVIPKDTDALLVLAPRRQLLAAEKTAIEQYLKEGGSAVFLCEPNTTKDVSELVAPYEIVVGDDIIVEPLSRLFEGKALGVQPVISSYSEHSITKEFNESIVLSTACSVRGEKKADKESLWYPNDKVEVNSIAWTNVESWAEKNVQLVFSENSQAEKQDDDMQGPIPVAAAFEREINSSTDHKKLQRIFVVGDADFVANVNIRQLFNRDFFLNGLNWVIGEEASLSIRAKSLKSASKALSPKQFRAIFILSGILFPEILLLIGFFVWIKRGQ